MALSIHRIFHFNINCSNLERSVAFYKRLGFKVVLDFGEGMESREMADAFNLKSARIRGVHLRLGDAEHSTRIDLLQFLGPVATQKPYSELNHLGVARICLKTDDIHKDYSELKQEGFYFLSEPKRLPGTAVTIACFTDPDGVFLELLEGDF
jgi:glyoxylase I family protein